MPNKSETKNALLPHVSKYRCSISNALSTKPLKVSHVYDVTPACSTSRGLKPKFKKAHDDQTAAMPQTISSIHDSLKAGKNSKPPEDNRVTQPSETASIVPKKMDDNTDGDSFKLADKNEQASVQDEVWLFDNIAFRPTPETPWRTEFVLAFFKENNVIREKITATIAELAQLFKLAPDDETTEKRIRERVAPFIRQIGQCMEAAVKYQQGGQLHLGPSNDSGIVSVEMPVPVPLDIRWDAEGHAPKPGDSRLMSIVNKENEGSPRHPATAGLETGKAFFAQDGGWGVISDIDDTIKVTEVRDRIKLLKNTFVNVPTPVEGMPDLYQQLHEAISTPKHPAPFIYLSASPYNLYPMLRGFVRSMFPEGMLILRDMSWMDMDAFVVTLTRGTQEYKDNRIVSTRVSFDRTMSDLRAEESRKLASTHNLGMYWG